MTNALAALTFHADGQRLETAVEQPRAKWIETAPEHGRLRRHFLQLRSAAGHHAGDQIRVPVEVLGGRVQNDVKTVVENAQVGGRREGRVGHGHGPMAVGQFGEGGKVGQPQHRV